MLKGKQIKIIKRAERHEGQAALSAVARTSGRNSAEVAKRDAVTVVTQWVRELRQKKVAQTALGFESLFSNAATSATHD